MDEITSANRVSVKTAVSKKEIKFGVKTSHALFARVQGVIYRMVGAPEGQVGSTRVRLRLAVFFIAIAAAFSACASVVVGGLRLSYCVSYNGNKLGFVASGEQAETVIKNVELKASDILGYEYELGNQISKKLSITGKNTVLDSKAVEKAVLDAIPEISRYYTVTVNDEIIGGVSSASEAYTLLNDILESHKTDGAISASFVEQVSVVKQDAPTEQLMEMEELLSGIEERISSGDINVATTYRASHYESIPYETECIDDYTMYAGNSKVITEGVEGQVKRTVEYTLIDGKLSSRELVENEIITNAVTETVAVGTVERPSYASTGSYIWPTSGILTSNFGPRSVAIGSSVHKGIDIGAAYGTAVYAADGGEVIYSDYMSGYGYLVQLRHDNGEVTYYAHCSKLVAKEGEHYAQGELIAYVGNTGVSSGAHLHFEVRINGTAVNPLTVLPEAES